MYKKSLVKNLLGQELLDVWNRADSPRVSELPSMTGSGPRKPRYLAAVNIYTEHNIMLESRIDFCSVQNEMKQKDLQTFGRGRCHIEVSSRGQSDVIFIIIFIFIYTTRVCNSVTLLWFPERLWFRRESDPINNIWYVIYNS